MNTPDAMELLLGGIPTAKFPEVGTTVVGKVLSTEVSQQTDIEGVPLTWDDGKPRLQIVATLQTEDRDPTIEDDDGRRRVFIKGQMMKAVGDAVRKAGAKELLNGRLAVRFKGQEAPSKPGRRGRKIYEAAFEPGSPPGVSALLNGGTAAPEQQQPATAGASADLLG
jgi:hypothetical protein